MVEDASKAVSAKVVILRERQHLSFKEIGQTFGIGEEAARQRYKKEKRKEFQRSRGEVYGFLGRDAGNALSCLLSGHCRLKPSVKTMPKNIEPLMEGAPTLVDLQRYIERNHDWRCGLLLLRNCSTTTVREIEQFAATNGIRIFSEEALGQFERATGTAPTYAEIRTFLENHADWRKRLSDSGCTETVLTEFREHVIVNRIGSFGREAAMRYLGIERAANHTGEQANARSERNQDIVRLREVQRLSFKEIGQTFGIGEGAASSRYGIEKQKELQRSRGEVYGFLGARAGNALDCLLHGYHHPKPSGKKMPKNIEVLKEGVPTLADLQRYIERNHDWRCGLLLLRNCSTTTVREIEQFAVTSGIRIFSEEAMEQFRRATGTEPTYAEIRTFLESHADWEKILSDCTETVLTEFREHAIVNQIGLFGPTAAINYLGVYLAANR